MLQSVDVSWPQANYTPDDAESGVIVAATSADGGSCFTQSTFVGDILNARRVGKPAGFYHFNGPGSATAQADYFWSVIKPYYRRGDVLALDIESSSGGTVPAMSSVWAAEFMNRLASNIGVTTHQLRLLIYGNRSDMRAAGWGALESAGCLLWLAAPGGYPENTAVGEWTHWTLLQYSTAGNIDRDESELTFAQIAGLGDEMTPEQANWLLQSFNAIFSGGSSMKDGGKSISQSLADIHALLTKLVAVPTVTPTIALTDDQVTVLASSIAAKLPVSVSPADVAAALKPALDALPSAVVAAEGQALSNG